MSGTPDVAARGAAGLPRFVQKSAIDGVVPQNGCCGDGGRSPEHLAQYDLMPCRKFVSGTLSIGASGGVMKLDGSLCNANVSLTDLIKGWFVALTKQLNAYPSRTIRLFASSRVKLVALAS